MMTFSEAVSWAASAGYDMGRLRTGLLVHEPVFLFQCTRCDFYLEEVTKLWTPDGVPEDMVIIPTHTIWNLGVHMGNHVTAKKSEHRKDRKLTSVEVSMEVSNIKTRPWPHNSMLPMKNLYTRSIGCIFRTYDGGPETILPEVVLAGSATAKTYSSLEKMVEDGWVVD